MVEEGLFRASICIRCGEPISTTDETLPLLRQFDLRVYQERELFDRERELLDITACTQWNISREYRTEQFRGRLAKRSGQAGEARHSFSDPISTLRHPGTAAWLQAFQAHRGRNGVEAYYGIASWLCDACLKLEEALAECLTALKMAEDATRKFYEPIIRKHKAQEAARERKERRDRERRERFRELHPQQSSERPTNGWGGSANTYVSGQGAAARASHAKRWQE